MAKPLTGPGMSRDANDNIIRQSQPLPTARRPFLSGGRVVTPGQTVVQTTSPSTPAGPTGGSGTTGAAGFARVSVSGGSVIEVSGPAVRAVTAAYTVLPSDDVIEVDATAGTVAVTLPLASSAAGSLLSIVKTDSSANAVTVTATSPDTIDGASTYSITLRYGAAWFYSDGTTWLALIRKFGSGAANLVLRTGDSGGEPTIGALDAADIPNLPASKITSGTLNDARLSFKRCMEWCGPPTLVTGADTLEVTLPADFSSRVLSRVQVRLQTTSSSGSFTIFLELSTASGAFAVAQTSDTFTIAAGSYETIVTSFTNGLTGSSGNKVRFNISGLGTGTANLTVETEWL